MSSPLRIDDGEPVLTVSPWLEFRDRRGHQRIRRDFQEDFREDFREGFREGFREVESHHNGGMTLRIRVATREDLPALRDVMARAIGELQRGFLDEAQIAASHEIMGLDTQLVDDGTYFLVEVAGDRSGTVCGCGGWSRRATLYGGDHTPGRDAALLDPRREPAKVRAMYTHPGYARRGIGRMILAECERAAAAEGFTRLELMGTLSGQPLYAAAGFEVIETLEDGRGGVPVPLVRMGKTLTN